MSGQPPWRAADSAALYGIDHWGSGYFSLADSGEVVANASFASGQQSVSLMEIVAGLEQRGHAMPVLLRIENILDDRITRLNETFRRAIAQLNYRGEYRGVFPIKVNQQCHVVEEITKFGGQYHHGLEAGSKAELMVALAHLRDREACIICNGYKDAEFIELGLHARRLGLRCFFVIETLAELEIIIRTSQRLGIEPLLGVRVKLAARVEGHWYEDSGDRSLFGLSVSQLINVVDRLRSAGMLHCLELMHYHIGSQIPNIRNIRAGVQEACRYFVDLVGEGAPLTYLDLGGGLAVDYTGAATNETHSKNYSLDEYCVDIVEAIGESLDAYGVAHPTIITESGRATVAYSSVLLFNVLDVSRFRAAVIPSEPPAECSDYLRNLFGTLDQLCGKNLQESCNDAVHYREEVRRMFRQGLVQLRELAITEVIYLEVLQRSRELLPTLARIPPELADLDQALADIYYGNFSLFQSLPDSWAIGQLFPVMPIHRNHERPDRTAIIADITCDSDGKIDHFAGPQGESRTLSLHPLRDGEEYYLGVFLVGAYQETLGDLHNLFGDTHVASVRIDENGSFEFVEEIVGDTIGDVLSYVEYNPKELYEQFRVAAEAAVKRGEIDLTMRRDMLQAFNASLNGYTYFEREQ